MGENIQNGAKGGSAAAAASGKTTYVASAAKRTFPSEAHEAFYIGLENAFEVPESGVEIKKKQCGKRGRFIWLPLCVLFATALYAFLIYFTNSMRKDLRYFMIAIETVVYAYFLARFVLAFVVDCLSARYAETVRGISSDGIRVYVSEGRYAQKLEYGDVRLVFWGKDSYEKFDDKGAVNPLASRYSKALQRRSSNLAAFDPWNVYQRLADSTPFELKRGEWCGVSTDDGELRLLLDDKGRVSRMKYKGGKELLYDSCSPVHIMDAKLPFAYEYEYEFSYPEKTVLYAPHAAATAIKDYLLVPPPAEAVTFG